MNTANKIIRVKRIAKITITLFTFCGTRDASFNNQERHKTRYVHITFKKWLNWFSNKCLSRNYIYKKWKQIQMETTDSFLVPLVTNYFFGQGQSCCCWKPLICSCVWKYNRYQLWQAIRCCTQGLSHMLSFLSFHAWERTPGRKPRPWPVALRYQKATTLLGKQPWEDKVSYGT